MTNIVERLAERVTSSLGTKVNYGEKITLGGVEAVPVSLVSFGFGGGGAEIAQDGTDGGEYGSGGGGGGGSIPVGMYVAAARGPRFVPNLALVLALSIPLVWVTGKSLARVIRVLKR
jgi:uncharacterized spore protein YtfJ